MIVKLSILYFESNNLGMVNLRCNDYGYECEYESEGEIDKVIDDYREHMNEEHGIDYSKEVILKFIKRKKSWNPKKQGLV